MFVRARLLLSESSAALDNLVPSPMSACKPSTDNLEPTEKKIGPSLAGKEACNEIRSIFYEKWLVSFGRCSSRPMGEFRSAYCRTNASFSAACRRPLKLQNGVTSGFLD